METGMSQKIVFADSVVNLIKGSGADQNPDLLDILLKRFNCGLANPPTTMPYDQFIALADYLRQTLLPHLSENEGWQKIGYDLMQANFSGVGKTNLVALRLLKVEDVVPIMINSRRATIPFGRQEADYVDNGCIIFHSYDIPTPPYLLIGQIQAGLEVFGIQDYQFSYSLPNPAEIILEIRFTPKFPA
jgi:Protein of unknown function (DUF2378)